jgi:TonB-dependent receptor
MNKRTLTDIRMASAFGHHPRSTTHTACMPRLCPVALAVAGLFGGGAAMAQQAPAAPEAAPAEVVVVTGQRASLRKAIAAQEAADNIISVISADDIGQMPDKNAAEALARMPGVAVQRDQGEGRYIVVRGMNPDYNSVTINGALVPSPESNRRAVALDVLPAGLIRSLEVTKTLTPEKDGNSLGGTVNVKTLSAFDISGGKLLSMQAGMGRDEFTKQNGSNAGVLWADRFAEGKLGVAIGASTEKRKFGSNSTETSDAVDGSLKGVDMRDYRPNRERAAAALNLDYRPESGQAYYLRSFYSTFSDEEDRDRLVVSNFSGAGITGGAAEQGETFSARGERRLRNRKYTQEVTSLVLGGERNLGDWRVSAAIGAGSAIKDTPEALKDAQFRGVANFTGVSYTGTMLPIVAVTPALSDPASYRLRGIVMEGNYSEDKEHHAEWTASRSVDLGGADTEIKFGSKWSRRAKTSDFESFIFNSSTATSPNYWGPGSILMSDFLRGPLTFKTANLGPGLSAEKLRARVAGLNRAAARDPILSTTADYNIDEDIDAAFLQASTRLGAWTVLGGVRNERTKMRATGFETVGTTAVTPLARARTYTNWLPALQARIDIDKQTTVRAAFSTSAVRPNFAQFSPGTFIEDAVTATVGNPDLKEMTSSNFDLGVERMLGGEGAASAYLFSKDVKDFTYRTNLAGTGKWAGYENVVSYANGNKAKVNGIELSYQQGLRMLPAPWNDIVLGANYSVVKSTAGISRFDKSAGKVIGRDIRLPGQAKKIYNASIGYEGAALSAKLSLNYKSDYLLEVGDNILDASRDRYVDDQRQIDFSAGYKFNKRYQMVFEAANLNNEHYYIFSGNRANSVQYERYGRTYKLSLKVTLY